MQAAQAIPAHPPGPPPRRPARRPRISTCLFGRTSVVVAWIVLTLAPLHPPQGLGLPVCWLHSTTGVPCPGCGLSRSISAAVRGDLARAVRLHPFGPVAVASFGAIAIVSMLPRRARRRFVWHIERRRRLAWTVYGALIAAFVLFGVLRAAAHLATHLPAPALHAAAALGP